MDEREGAPWGISERPELRLQVLGFTDSRGGAKANERISQQRADAVKAALVAQASIAGDRIEAKVLGNAEPLADNETEEGRAQNRRVELRIVDESGGFTTRIVPGRETALTQGAQMGPMPAQ